MSIRSLVYSPWKKASIRASVVLLGLILIAGLFLAPSQVFAASIVVTTTVDTIDAAATCSAVTLASLPGLDGKTSLREAICAANNNPGSDTITFSVNGTFLITGAVNEDDGDKGDFDIKQSLVIHGNGVASTIIDGNGIERIFDVFPSAAATFELRDLTLQNGDTRTTSFKEGGAMYLHNNVTTTLTNCQIINNFSGANGAVENRGTLTITNCVFSGNQTIPDTGTVVGGALRNAGELTITNSTFNNNSVRGEGGAIAITSNQGVNVSIQNTTFSNNQALVTGGALGNGGAISTTGNNGNISIRNSTFSANKADNNGGAIYHVTPGGTPTGNLTLNNVTITANRADQDNNASGVGGGVYQNIATTTLQNSLIAKNYRSTTSTHDDINGAIAASSSHNLVGVNTGLTGITHAVNNNSIGTSASPTDPLLDALADNGPTGTPQTHALLLGSPAIDKGNNATCLPSDQRGQTRINICDIGAYEHVPDTTPPDTTITGNPPASSASSNATFSFIGSDNVTPPSLITFQCRIDSASFGACTSPYTYPTPLADGSHTFQVRAIDAAGNIDSTPASYTWTIDATPPQTSIDSKPNNPSSSTSASFSFSGTDNTSVASFQCRLDSASFAACTSPIEYDDLNQGSHAFYVRAIDGFGNIDPTPAAFAWVVDTTAPDTSIDTKPSDPSASTNASFTFSGGDAGGSGVASFECQIDGGGYTACTTSNSHALTGLSEGSHTFDVRAIDAAGNVDPTPASYTWEVDTTAPNTSIDDGKPTDPSTSADASFTFSGNDADGSGVASFECQLDGAGYTACTTPQNYTGLSEGSHTFEVRAIDKAGNVDPTPASYTWEVDITAPNTTIDTKPTDPSASANASFSFTGNDGAGSGLASFECQIDGGGYTACSGSNSHSLTGLSEGWHTFEVRAIDNAGNVDATPPSYTWLIDTTAPTTTIDDKPADPSASAAADFTFTSSDGTGSGLASFECQIDGGGYTACSGSNSHSLTGLSEGSHTFEVRAIDKAGNVDPTPASYTWVVDTTAPTTTIDNKPSDPSASADASFTFSGNDADGSGVASFECQLDGAGYTTCTTPQMLSGLSEGSHTFDVRAIDNAGNVDATPASYTWVVDTTAPNTTIDTNPSDPSASTNISFTFSGNDSAGSGVASFECQLDGAAYAACTSPQSYPVLSDGSHSFNVRAIDKAGNVDPTPASYTWAVDALSPTVVISSSVSGATNQPVLLTITFSESVSGFTINDLTVQNATLGNFTGSGSSYTVVLVPIAEANVTVDIAAGVANDNVGNPNLAAPQWSISYDVSNPSVTVEQAATQNDPTNLSPISFTVTFSEEVTGFDDPSSDLLISGSAGATTATITGSGRNYTVQVSGMTSAGDILLSVPAGAASDLAGNPNTASTSVDNKVSFDSVLPAVTGIARVDPNPTNAANVDFTVTFSKAVFNVDANDFSIASTGITGASITSVSGSGTTWTVSVNTGSGSGTLRLDLLNNGSIVDGSNNPLTADFTSGQSYTIDKAAPVVSNLVVPSVIADTTSLSFTVRISDTTAVLRSSIVDGLFNVTGPNGYDQIVTVVEVMPNSDGSPLSVRLSIPAPGGSWDEADDGSYSVQLLGDQLQDSLGNRTQAALVGTFAVNLTKPNYTVYLPLVSNQVETKADLVGKLELRPKKSQFSAGEQVDFAITISNQGNAPASGFWVDLMINPRTQAGLPKGTWNESCSLQPCYGLAWFIDEPLAPGQQISLSASTSETGYTVWPGSFAAGTTDLYLVIDSWGPQGATSLIDEKDESNNIVHIGGLKVLANPSLVAPSTTPSVHLPASSAQICVPSGCRPLPASSR